MGALIYDAVRTEDASSEPHDVTHAPEALRYALMSRFAPRRDDFDCNRDFSFGNKRSSAVNNYFY